MGTHWLCARTATSLDETEAQIRATLPGRPPAADSPARSRTSLRTAAHPSWPATSRRCSTSAGRFAGVEIRRDQGHQKGRGAKRIVANTMADCLAFLAEHPGSSVRVLTTGAAEDRSSSTQALAGQNYVDAGTGPIGCTIATHVGVDAIAISYCPRYQPTH